MKLSTVPFRPPTSEAVFPPRKWTASPLPSQNWPAQAPCRLEAATSPRSHRPAARSRSPLRRRTPLASAFAWGGASGRGPPGSGFGGRRPRPIRMESGVRRGPATAGGPASATPTPRHELGAGAGAEARARGPSAVGARRFLLCLYLVGFLVSAGAGSEGRLRPGPGTRLGVAFFLKPEWLKSQRGLGACDLCLVVPPYLSSLFLPPNLFHSAPGHIAPLRSPVRGSSAPPAI